MAYLITCAGSKKQSTVYNPSDIINLSFNSTLRETREHIIDVSRVVLNWDYTLPAWKLYSGKYSRLYPRVDEHNWLNPNVEIKILSALFGWIKHTDLIPYYDLKMDSIIGSQRVHRVWLNAGVLPPLIENVDIDLLSNTYRKAINRRGLPVAIVPDVVFPDRGDSKGTWLNEQTENLVN